MCGQDGQPPDVRTLIAVHRGVFGVGNNPASTAAVYLAAVLACGTGAVVFGTAAAYLLQLVSRRIAPPPEVIARSARRVPGVAVRRVRDGLDPLDCGWVEEVPVTSPARTLVDLAPKLSEEHLGRAVHEAIVLHHLTPQSVESALSRWPTAPGARKLRRVIHGDERITLSRLERLFLALLRRHRLPLPETNRNVGGRFVDCRWPERKLTVELDSYHWHKSRLAWEKDRRREREAYARGDQFRRFTWGDVVEQPAPVVSELRNLLESPS
jgi:very-short-patch-repair endonuclease